MTMVVGTLTITLQVPDSGSLKDKRQVVRSLTARLRQTFNVGVAEVGDQNLWQSAVIGIACPFCQTMFRDALAQVSATPPKLLDIAQIAAASIKA